MVQSLKNNRHRNIVCSFSVFKKIISHPFFEYKKTPAPNQGARVCLLRYHPSDAIVYSTIDTYSIRVTSYTLHANGRRSRQRLLTKLMLVFGLPSSVHSIQSCLLQSHRLQLSLRWLLNLLLSLIGY